MSRRKQLKPQPLKDDNEYKKRMESPIKPEDNSEDGEELTLSLEEVIGRAEEGRVKREETEEKEESGGGEEGEEKEGQPVECALCSLSFPSIPLLQMHTLSLHAPQPSPPVLSTVACQQCDAVLPSLSLFAFHMRTHLSNPIFECLFCSRSFTDEERWMQHTREHLIVRAVRLECSICSNESGTRVSFPDSSSFTKHSVDKHVRILFLCTICDASFNNHLSLKIHSADHATETTKLLCRSCEMTFDLDEEADRHIKNIHSVDTKKRIGRDEVVKESTPRFLVCSVCDEKCPGEDALDEHRLYAHCKVARADACAECHASIPNVNSFIEHCKKHADTLMNCVVCRQSVRSEVQLKLHATFHSFSDSTLKKAKDEEEETTPSPPQFFHCPVCSKSFPSLSSLHSHSLLHRPSSSSPKGLCCHICGFRFNSQSRLETHMKKHARALSASCQICGMEFSNQEELSDHMVTHKQSLEERGKAAVALSGSS